MTFNTTSATRPRAQEKDMRYFVTTNRRTLRFATQVDALVYIALLFGQEHLLATNARTNISDLRVAA